MGAISGQATSLRRGPAASFRTASLIQIVALYMRVIDGENPIKIWREWRGATISDLADAVGLHGEQLVAIEKGEFVSMREKLAAALEVLSAQLQSPIFAPKAFPRSKPNGFCQSRAGGYSPRA